ncbi:MAG TPA: molybdopterin molybdotransferase MoeA [Chitinophagaceae bacterium]|nr:molybdopterin molybdotransferase MoeA [Chitinophagaceae bacterium]
MAYFIPVEEAETMIQLHTKNFGTSNSSYENAVSRILAEDLFADRDLPPANRSSMDGIAISYEAFQKNIRSFKIKGTQGAGDPPIAISNSNECVEIMTGAALDHTVDTVIRVEDLDLEHNIATIKVDHIRKNQCIHAKGKDQEKGALIATKNQKITPALIGLAASIGKTKLEVKNLPKVVIITTGDEMIPPEATPENYQLRRSNGITMQTALTYYGIQADRIHLNDNVELIKNELSRCLKSYDLLLMSGGVSMGKFDYIPKVLEELGIIKHFHKIKQKPGKPFWFGTSEKEIPVFAFPGNPVSTYVCFIRYFIPWLKKSLNWNTPSEYAVLQEDITFPPDLQYFLLVRLSSGKAGNLLATPIPNNGSGDFSSLIHADAFLELPRNKNEFKKGTTYRLWRYNL